MKRPDEYVVLKTPLSEMQTAMNMFAKRGYWYLDSKETSERRRGGTEGIWIIIMRYRGTVNKERGVRVRMEV